MEFLYYLSPVLVFGVPLLVGLAGLAGMDGSPRRMRQVSLWGAATAFGAALFLAASNWVKGSFDEVFAIVGNPQSFHFTLGVWVDALSTVMVLLITSIGLVVQRYSIRYLDGDEQQGRFFSWLSIVLGSVSLFVMSRNLLALTLAWFVVSFAIHRLLLYFPQREAAQKAAWRKFIVSRLGDSMLIVALAITYYYFGTFEMQKLFELAAQSEQGPFLSVLGFTITPMALVGALYVIGAMTKSAQFPFHIWLPDTMEAPTPVSALMHAGIINAGGFLIVRLSPIVSHASLALHVLLIVGAFTALFAGLILLVQSDIKRSLAYSTISQMGYMMMQCGVGAYAAGVLHLVMHGYYKAYAFLTAGSSISPHHFSLEKNQNRGPVGYVVAGVVSLALLVLCVQLLGISMADKPGAVLLSVFLWGSATHALANAYQSKVTFSTRVITTGAAFAGMLLYWIALGAFDTLLGSAVEHTVFHSIEPWLLYTVAIVFLLSYIVAEAARHSSGSAWADRLYVLCINHFYIEYAWRWFIHKALGNTPFMPSFENTALGISRRKGV